MKYPASLIIFTLAFFLHIPQTWSATDVVNDASLKVGLISCWTMDEASGTRADNFGTNTLSDTNTVASATGKISNGADFERGSSEYLSITDGSQSGLDISGDWSVSMWYKPETVAGNGNLLTKFQRTTNRSYRVFITDSDVEAAYSSDGTNSNEAGKLTTGNFISSTATWYHIVVTADVSAKTFHIYINDSDKALTDDSAGNATSVFNGTAAFGIGATDLGSTPIEFVDGIVDEVGIWSKELTSTEVSALYNSGNGIPCGTVSAALPTPVYRDITTFE